MGPDTPAAMLAQCVDLAAACNSTCLLLCPNYAMLLYNVLQTTPRCQTAENYDTGFSPLTLSAPGELGEVRLLPGELGDTQARDFAAQLLQKWT